ncbi:MAG TPA: transcriptional repressor [Candidatus Cloacimonetes bacterium]|nr:transcriptional repressor [Candidatus Cloacimonadota bacterium]HEX37271.1 transcriptional repressor [Candidatus Cloacimonadota bacterium]
MINKYIETLQKHGLKRTPKRLEVLRILSEESAYISPQKLHVLLKEKFLKIGLPTVYRILQQFQNIGIVTSIQQDDNQLYYYLCDCVEKHHHFICRKCHKVSCLTYCDFDNIKQLVADQLDSLAETHVLQIEGLCKECLES